MIRQGPEKPDLTLKSVLFLGIGLDWELERFFFLPSLNYSDSVRCQPTSRSLEVQGSGEQEKFSGYEEKQGKRRAGLRGLKGGKVLRQLDYLPLP